MRISHEDRWEQNLITIVKFIKKNKCWPSKHRIEEHQMLNWLKYNRKLHAQGKLSPERQEKFNKLLASAANYHKLNQYSYTSGAPVLKKAKKKRKTIKELSLF